MCAGGGGNGDAAAREEKRQKEQNLAVHRLSRLFGYHDPNFDGGRPDRMDYTKEQQVADPMGDADTTHWVSVLDKNRYDKDVANWEAEQAIAQAEADKNKTGREQIYTGLRDDTFNYYQNDLQQQHADTLRNMKFALARSGQRGGSVELDNRNDITESYDRAILDIGNRADNAANRLRTTDEQARLDLISRINAGMSGDAAIQSANQQLTNAVNDAKANATAIALGNVFRDYGAIMTEEAKKRGRASVQSFNLNPGNYYGTSANV